VTLAVVFSPGSRPELLIFVLAASGVPICSGIFTTATGMTAEVEKKLQSKFKELRERLDWIHVSDIVHALRS
jgi:hypothetical protein